MTPAGTKVEVVVTYLEMRENPGFSAPGLPDGYRLELAIDPPVWYFLVLYGTVGRDWEWHGRFEQPKAKVEAFVSDQKVEIWTLTAKGWPQGFFVLDFRDAGVVDLAYFGLTPEAVGSGIGKRLLRTAIAKGWARADIDTMTVNTCTLDHPRALGLYRSQGFEPVDRETYTRVLARDRVAPFAEPA